MTKEEIDQAFRFASVEALERIRRVRERLPERFAARVRCIEKSLFTPGFGAREARRLGGSEELEALLGKSLTAYLEQHRIETAMRMLQLAGGRMPTGRAARAVGLADFWAYRRAFKRCTGEYPTLLRFPSRLSLKFDAVSWHHACQGLPSFDAQSLSRRLGRLYPAAFAGGVPCAETVPRGKSSGTRAHRYVDISDDEAEQALERAAGKSLARIRADAQHLPPKLAQVFQEVARNLFDSDLSVDLCRKRVGVRDTGISTKILFFVGDTFAEYIEKRRIETAVILLADLRFSGKRLYKAVGLSYGRFCRAFERRTGAHPSDVRKTLKATCAHPAYKLWSRAESEGLSVAEARTLGGHLRALYPDALEGLEPALLAVRADVDPGQVQMVIQLTWGTMGESRAMLNAMLRTHPDYSAAHWYSHWIRDRLGRAELDSSWAEWQMANRDLRKLLQFPPEQRTKLVEEVQAYQSGAFLWLLVDCVAVRLFHDTAGSEHFADLALTAAEARWRRDRGSKSAGLLALTLALKGNALKRRNELEEASQKFEKALWAIRAFGLEQWIIARVHGLYATFLYCKGEELKARRALFLASANFKRAPDELERLRCVIDRSAAWFSMGKDPSRLLTICIATLDRFPFANDLRHIAHVARILANIYLSDRLTSRHLSTIKDFRIAMPPATSTYASAEYQQVDGLIAALDNKPELAVSRLKGAADWFADHDLLGDAAVCWLQYSWAAVELDSAAASQAAITAYAYMERTGFKSQGLQKIALKIYHDAQQCDLSRDLLRRGILLMVCPKLEARLG